MNPEDPFEVLPTDAATMLVQDIPLADAVVEVYETAPPATRRWMMSQLVVAAFESATPLVRRHLLKRLIGPLGLLSLAGVAGGVFAKIRLRSGWEDLQLQIDDVQNVNASDLAALVDHVQQVSAETVTGVARVIAASPWLAGSAIAAVLVTMFVRNARLGRHDGDDEDGFPAASI